MDPTNRAPETPDNGEGRDGGGAAENAPALARVVQLVAGDYLLTVNPVDGSEIESCPPGRLPARPERLGTAERAELLRAAAPPAPARPAGPRLPLVGRAEERERLGRLLSRGRSVRVTGPAATGRSTLLDAVAADCVTLAPDGVVRLSGHRRTTTDLLHELFAAVHRAPLYRPDRAELLAAVREIGAVVVLDDLEFGGAALDELLDATPECAWLLAATPGIAAPSADCHLEEVFLGGLDRTDCLELLEAAVGRPLTDEEADWVADLWFESEGLPLRFVQAGALLRQRLGLDVTEVTEGDEKPYSIPVDGPAEEDGRGALPSVAEAAAPVTLLAAGLSESARATLGFALALGGEVPHQAQLPALVGDTHADAAVGELLAGGLITAVGAHYRLAAGVAEQLLGADGAPHGADTGERAHSAAQHYSWWAGHPSVAPERIAAEADAILAALGALVTGGRAGQPAAAVLLARTAAPAFAAALHWGAWERALRYGQEAARLAGEVGEEAYFHHELGVLALCTGNLDRARAELETSVGMRGALKDKRGAVAGRRALALVADRSRPAEGVPAAALPPVPPGAGDGRTPAGEEVPDARREESASPSAGAPGAFAGYHPDDATTTIISRIPAPVAPGGAPGGRPAEPGSLAKRLMAGGNRRNLLAAGAGVLLAAVLGTAVTLGAASGGHGGGGGHSEKVKPGQSASRQDGDGGLNADQPAAGESGGAPAPGRSGQPERPGRTAGPSGAASSSPGASGSASPPASESGSPGTHRPPTPSGEPSHSPTQSPGDGKTTPPPVTHEPTPPTKSPPKTPPAGTPQSSGGSNSASGTAPGGGGRPSRPVA